MADRILVVNDSARSRNLLTLLLEGAGYEAISARNGQEALDKVRTEFPDLALLDVSLSGMDAADIAATLRADSLTSQMPIIAITPFEEPGRQLEPVRQSADDIITKPFRNNELLDRIATRLCIRNLEDAILIANKELLTARRTLKGSIREIEKTHQDTIYSLLVALETRDPYTSGHAKMVSTMCLRLADALDFDAQTLKHMEYASALHDVGKIGIPYDILMKEGKLDADEEAEMRKHPDISVQIIKPIGFLQRIIPIVRHHHEAYDGSGYPDGLRRDQIPIESRIITVVDAYHAMVSDRPYRRAMPTERAAEILRSVSGTQFDPDILDAFFNMLHSQHQTQTPTPAIP